jgi:hypothetical protein
MSRLSTVSRPYRKFESFSLRDFFPKFRTLVLKRSKNSAVFIGDLNLGLVRSKFPKVSEAQNNNSRSVCGT